MMDFAVSAEHRVLVKEGEKTKKQKTKQTKKKTNKQKKKQKKQKKKKNQYKYLDLAREQTKLWNIKVTVTPIVVRAF